MRMLNVNQLTQQLRKDWMRTKLMHVAFAAIAIGGVVVSARAHARAPSVCVGGCFEDGGNTLALAVTGIMTLLVVLATIALVHDDAPIDPNAWWLSQPIDVGALLASKGLLTLAYFVGVIAIAQVVTLQVNGLNVVGSASLILSSVQWFLNAIVFSCLLAGFTRRAQTALLIGLALLAVEFLFSLTAVGAIFVARETGGVLSAENVCTLLALPIVIWLYAAKAVRARTRYIVAGVTTFVVLSSWNAQTYVLLGIVERESTALPAVTFTLQKSANPDGQSGGLILTLTTTIPRAGHRYRFSQYVVSARNARDSSKLDIIAGGNAGPIFVHADTSGDASSLQPPGTLAAQIVLSNIKLISDCKTTLTVSGFLVEERLYDAGSMPIAPGNTLQYDASRFTILAIAQDSSIPQLSYDALSGGTRMQFAQPFVDGAVTMTSSGNTLPLDAPPESYVTFHGGKDTLKLANVQEMLCHSTMPIPAMDIRATCGSLRAELGGSRAPFPKPDWLQDSKLFWKQWRRVSFKRIQTSVEAQVEGPPAR